MCYQSDIEVTFLNTFIERVNCQCKNLEYWAIQNDCGQVWQLCTKIYVAIVWVG
jgi:hypothetical protein